MNEKRIISLIPETLKFGVEAQVSETLVFRGYPNSIIRLFILSGYVWYN